MRSYHFLSLSLFSVLFLCTIQNSWAGVPQPPAGVHSPWIKPGDELGKPGQCEDEGNPIDRRTGNKFQEEIDYLSPYQYGLNFKRFYNSRKLFKGNLYKRTKNGSTYYTWAAAGESLPILSGSTDTIENNNSGYAGSWNYTYSQYLELIEDEFGSKIVVHSADGKKTPLGYYTDKPLSQFTTGSLNYKSKGTGNSRLTRLTDGQWKLEHKEDKITELYDQTGKLTSIEYANGHSHVLSYETNKITVTDDFNNQLVINLFNNQKLNYVELPDGQIVKYSWQNDLLLKAYYPNDVQINNNQKLSADTPFREYKYLSYDPVKNLQTVSASYYWAEYTMLTSITDESGNNYVSWQYDYTPGETYTKYQFARAKQSALYGEINKVVLNLISGSYLDVGIEVTKGDNVTTKYTYSTGNANEVYRGNIDSDSEGTGCAREDITTRFFTNYISFSHGSNGYERATGYALRKRSKENGFVSVASYQQSTISYKSGREIKPFPTHKTALKAIYEYHPKVEDGGYSNGTSCIDGNLTAGNVCSYRNTSYSYNSSYGDISQISKTGQTLNYLLDGKLPGTNSITDTTAIDNKPYDTKGNTRVTRFNYYETIDPSASVAQNADKTINRQLKSIDGPRTDVSDITRFEYYPSGHAYQGLLHKSINALNHETIIETYNNGKPQRIVSPNNLVTELGYHYRGWLNSITVDNDTTEIKYYDNGLIKQITLADNSFTKFKYNQAHLLTEISNNLNEKISYSDFDHSGNARKIENKNAAGISKFIQRFVTDKLGRLDSVLGQDGQETALEYNLNGGIDKLKELAKKVGDAKTNNETSNKYDVFGRIRETHYPDTGIIKLDYDKRDNLTKVTAQNNLVTEYIYDGLDNLVQITSPDTGVTIFWYDDAGNQIKRQQANNQITEYQYDALNRLTDVIYTDNAQDNIHYDYDETGGNDSKNGLGQLTKVTDITGTTEYWYDVKGQVVKEQKQLLTGTFTTEYAYSNIGKLTKQIFPSGRILEFRYDTIGRISRIFTQTNSNAAQVELANNFKYHPYGPQTEVTLGNGLQAINEFDTDYRLTKNQLIKASTKLYDNDYQYELTNEIDHIADLVNISQSQDFDYDSMHRLDVASGDYGILDHNYDTVGNRTQLTLDANTQVYDYKGTNKLDNITQYHPQSYQYDDLGNLSFNSLKNHTYYYNSQNQLRQIKKSGSTIVDYTYNAFSQRVSKVLAAETRYYHYDMAGQLIAESDETGNFIREYLYLNGQLLAVMEQQAITWQGKNLETNASLATTSEQQDALVITGKGNNADFYYHAMQNDGSLSASIADFDVAKKQSSQLGLMIRDSINADSAFASINIVQKSTLVNISGHLFIPTYANVAKVQLSYRTSDNAALNEELLTLKGRNIKLERYGSEIRLYSSENGTDWSLLKTVNIALSTEALIGINSQNLQAGTQVALNNVSLTGDAITAEEIGVNFVHNDHLATPKLVTNASGDIIWRANTTPFGAAYVEQDVDQDGNSFVLNIRFPGQYYDAESGLHYNWHRYYDPEIGRYITSDPIGLAAGINTYGYAYQNSIMNIDPRGLFVPQIAGGLGGFAFGIWSALAQGQTGWCAIRSGLYAGVAGAVSGGGSVLTAMLVSGAISVAEQTGRNGFSKVSYLEAGANGLTAGLGGKLGGAFSKWKYPTDNYYPKRSRLNPKYWGEKLGLNKPLPPIDLNEFDRDVLTGALGGAIEHSANTVRPSAGGGSCGCN